MDRWQVSPNLHILIWENNQINSLAPLAGLTNLAELRLTSNQISNLSPLAGLTKLIILDLSGNQINNLAPLADLIDLSYLDLDNNHISSLAPLAGLTHLTELDVRYSPINSLAPLAGLTNLIILVIVRSQVNDLSPLVGLTNLTHLDLADNQINNLSPLAGLINLTNLWLQNNQISNLAPLAGLTHLTELNLSGNQIIDIAPLTNNMGLGAGDSVDLRNNPLSPTSVTVYIPALRTKGVTVLWDTMLPDKILSPVIGQLQVVSNLSDCLDTKWCFNQHKTGSHSPNGGIGGADDTWAWDANLNYPKWDSDNGMPVYATSPGIVAATYGSKQNAGGPYGAILIEHPYQGHNWWSGYLHLSHIQVFVGQTVTENTILGYISDVSPDAISPHLHFVIYSGSNTLGRLVSFNTTIVERPKSNPPPPVRTATGLGTVTFSSDTGTITGLTGITESTLPITGKPMRVIFPYGLFSFNITDIALGSSVTINVTCPSAITSGTQYWKVHNGNWINCTSLIQSINDNTLTLKLTDGGLGDADGVANGIIVDPGGVATQEVPNPLIGNGTPTSHGSSVAGTATMTQPMSLPNIQIQSASLSASKVAPGTPVTVTANIVNRGTVNGTTMVKVYVNGAEDSSQGITVESGGNRLVYFTVSRSQPGTYDVYIGGTQAGSFMVEDAIDSNIILYVSLSLIFFAFVLGMVMVVRRKSY